MFRSYALSIAQIFCGNLTKDNEKGRKMSTDSQWAVQTLLFDRLQNDVSLQALLSQGSESIFDHVPDNTAYPYCVIGAMSLASNDTKTGTGVVIRVSIDSYSRVKGFKELKSIMVQISSLLDRHDFTHPEHDIISTRFISSQIENRDGGQSRQGRQIFEIITEPKV